MHQVAHLQIAAGAKDIRREHVWSDPTIVTSLLLDGVYSCSERIIGDSNDSGVRWEIFCPEAGQIGKTIKLTMWLRSRFIDAPAINHNLVPSYYKSLISEFHKQRWATSRPLKYGGAISTVIADGRRTLLSHSVVVSLEKRSIICH